VSPSEDEEGAIMSATEHFDVIILGSGQGGKQLAWHLGRSGKKGGRH
jgi:cation diffusion facilitator CzcD-associated flavoprotein CzcO